MGETLHAATVADVAEALCFSDCLFCAIDLPIVVGAYQSGIPLNRGRENALLGSIHAVFACGRLWSLDFFAPYPPVPRILKSRHRASLPPFRRFYEDRVAHSLTTQIAPEQREGSFLAFLLFSNNSYWSSPKMLSCASQDANALIIDAS